MLFLIAASVVLTQVGNDLIVAFGLAVLLATPLMWVVMERGEE